MGCRCRSPIRRPTYGVADGGGSAKYASNGCGKGAVAALLAHLVYRVLLGTIAGTAAAATARQAWSPLNKLGR